ncbi:MAG TPA: phage major capsid protein [Acidobacteria bacterium]|nr:phage major capsid protein [Nocardioides sp.]HIE95107.1 phage major capsid protein [Acidobacteriota bacterium]
MDPEITELRAKLDKLEQERRSINDTAGDAALDADQQVRWEQIDTEEDEARTALAAAEERVNRAQRVAESRARWGSLHVGETVANDDVQVRSLSAAEARDRALKRLETDGKELRAEQLDKVDRLLRSSTKDRDASVIARRLLATENDHYRSAFQKAMTSPTPTWTAEEARAMDEFRTMSIGVDTAGGYGVPVLIDPTIILTAQESPNPFWGISNVKQITNDEWKGVSSAGVSWSFDAESAEVSDDTPATGQPSVPAHMARGFVPFTVEIGGDYPGFAEEISRLLGAGYDELALQKFTVGSGNGEPTGIFTALDANTNVEVVVTTDGAFGAVDIGKVWKALPAAAQANATWLMSEGLLSDIGLLGDAYGTRTAQLTETVERIRNRPVATSAYAPSFTGSTGAANLLVVGDFRHFVIAQRVGMSVEYVPHLFGVTNGRPTGERGYFAYARIGSDSVADTKFRLLQNQ